MLDLSKFKVYIVGGYVRDRALGLEGKDHDFVVVGATPQDMIEAGFSQVGASFPVFLSPNGDEYALARTERKVAPGYSGFETRFDPSITLEDDLRRRDLTINAMAREVIGWNEQGHAKLSDTIIDPYEGLYDLKNGILRHVSEAFAEDPLRVLRVARFAARYRFRVEKSTLELMKTLVHKGEIDYLTPERIWVEVEKVLKCDYPSRPSLFFRVLEDCSALEVLMPEVRASLDDMCQSLDNTTKTDTFTSFFTIRFGVINARLTPDKVINLCKRINAPDRLTQIAVRASILNNQCRTGILTSLEMFNLFKQIDAIRQYEIAYEAIHAVLWSMTDDDMPLSSQVRINMGNFIISLNAARVIAFSSLTEEQRQTLKGKEISDAINKLRLAAIQSNISNFT